jgi:hypothetical protein
MEEAPENGKESPHSAHANGMNERQLISVSPALSVLKMMRGSRFLQNIATYLSDYMTTLQQIKFIAKWVGDFCDS